MKRGGARNSRAVKEERFEKVTEGTPPVLSNFLILVAIIGLARVHWFLSNGVPSFYFKGIIMGFVIAILMVALALGFIFKIESKTYWRRIK